MLSPCNGEKRYNVKRKRFERSVEQPELDEEDEEVSRQIKRDSELLLHLTFAGTRDFQNIVI
jgi:hypothetical protein